MRPVDLCWLIGSLLWLGGCAAPPDPTAAPAQQLAVALARARAERQAAPAAASADLARPAVLRASLARPAAEVLPRLGGVDYTLELSAEAREVGGALLAEFRESRWLRVAPTGEFSLVHQVDWSVPGDAEGRSGRRCVWRDGRYFVARRFGPATALPAGPEAVEAAQACLASALEPLQGLVDRVVDELDLAVSGATEIRGRRAERVVGLWAQRPAQVPPAVAEAWGEGHRARAVDSPAVFGPRGPLFVEQTDLRGARLSLTLDGASGAPLEALVEAEFAFRKLSRDGRLALKLRVQSAAAGGPVAPLEGDRRAEARPRPFTELAAWVAAPPPAADAGLPEPGDEPAELAVDVERVAGDPAAPAAPTQSATDRREEDAP